jgi:hypothetical protein
MTGVHHRVSTRRTPVSRAGGEMIGSSVKRAHVTGW